MPEISDAHAALIAYALEAAAVYAVVPTMLVMLAAGYWVVRQ